MSPCPVSNMYWKEVTVTFHLGPAIIIGISSYLAYKFFKDFFVEYMTEEEQAVFENEQKYISKKPDTTSDEDSGSDEDSESSSYNSDEDSSPYISDEDSSPKLSQDHKSQVEVLHDEDTFSGDDTDYDADFEKDAVTLSTEEAF